MASIPPNYPPAAYASARRAQRDAYRAQRQYWRAMRRPSVVRPLVLISIGVVALLLETGSLNASYFWDWYVRWWPLLLIGVGLLLLGEWYINRDHPYGVRSGGGGVLGLLILFALIGFAGHNFRHGGGPFGWHFGDDNDMWQMHFFGQAHDADHQLDEALPADALLHVDNPRGDVVVTGSSDGRIHVDAHSVVYASNDRTADRLQAKLMPQLHINGRQARLSTVSLNQGTSDLTVQIPPGSTAEINANHGDVSVSGIQGSVSINSDRGDVKVTQAGNSVSVKMGKGDLSLSGIKGPVSMSGRVNDATLTGIDGRVSLNGDFFGDVSLSNISAPVSFHSSRTSLDVEHIQGELSLNSGDLHVSRSGAPVRITTRAKDINLSDIAGGPVSVENTDGDIGLSMTSPPGDVDLHNKNGDIQVTLPENAAYTVDATAPMGDISSDWSLGGDGNTSGHTFSGHLGSGSGHMPTIRLVSDHGNIQLKKGSGAPSPQPNPSPNDKRGGHMVPVPPAPPHAPHLRVPADGVAEPSTE